MSASSTRASVAIFAKSPVPGRVKTRLVPPLTEEEAAGVARACLEDTLRRFVPAVEKAEFSLHWDGAEDAELFVLASSLGVRVVPQAVGNLGKRLRAAFRALRAESVGAAGAAAGAETGKGPSNGPRSKVLAIGSDSPTLDPARIREAIAALDSNDVVLGPAEDGGYYLIGTRGDADAIFDAIPWSTPDVARETLERAAVLGLRVHQLPVWYDVDDVVSLRRALRDGVAGTSSLSRAAPHTACF